jgi:hypothetical protein
VRINDYVMAIACKKDTDHAENKACIYRPEDGTDVFDVSLVLCSDPCKLFIKKITGVLFFSNTMVLSER